MSYIVSTGIHRIILRCTVSIGTCRKIKETVESDIDLIFAPERTIEGNAIKELFSLIQIIGSDIKEMQILLHQYSRLGVEIVRASSWEAEISV